jgi:hypothetical protein
MRRGRTGSTEAGAARFPGAGLIMAAAALVAINL